MSVFNEMADAQAQSRGIKIEEDGDFIVRVDAVKMEESNEDKTLLYVAEYTIVESSSDDNPHGAERSWVQRPEQRRNTDMGNIKVFVGSCEGIKEVNSAKMKPETFEASVSDAQPYAGTILRLSTQMIITKGSKRPFCIHNWSPFEGDVDLLDIPVKLTKEAWQAGEGPGTEHPSDPKAEFHPDHTDWGCRGRKVVPGAAPATPAEAAPPVPSDAPSVGNELTKEAWLAGTGDGTVHPQDAALEWRPGNADWGTRPAKPAF
jgi:hypothetical protein